MLNSETPGRTLSSLTQAECRILFAEAFGCSITTKVDVLYNGGPLTLKSLDPYLPYTLMIFPDGRAMSWANVDNLMPFNMRKVAACLDDLRIQIVPQP